MKNLFFKELKLSIHPACYIFCVAFALMALIPGYPAFISTVYALASYTFLFLGANKGATTNDLFYTVNLPVRKQDVVKARLMSVGFLQLLSIATTIVLLIIGRLIQIPGSQQYGLNITQGFGLVGIFIAGFAVTDLIYIPWFYKTGKSILGPTLTSVLVYCALMVGLDIILPVFVPAFQQALTIGGENANYALQFGILGGGIAFYAISRVVIYKLSSKRLLKIDM